MKTAVIFVALIATCTAFELSDVAEGISKLEALWVKCVVEKNLSPEAVMKLLTEEGQDVEEINCARACFMTETNVMTDNKINIELIEGGTNAVPWFQEHPQIKDTLLGVFKGCAKAAASGENECDTAGKMSLCYKAIKDRIIAVIVEAAAAGA